MPRTIVLSICSREKSKIKKPIPARERYLGSHILIAEVAARAENLPFFILTGKFGLLAADGLVSYYDHPLKEYEVARLVVMLCRQLARLPFSIGEICFYTKQKPAWQPYNDALKQAAQTVNIKLAVINLPDDA